MANEEQQQAWAKQGVDWVEHAAIFEAVLAPFADAVLAAADLGSGNRVLDIGCGTGALLERAVERGADAVGVDISEPMVQAAQRRVPPATVALGDAQTLDLGSLGSFDRVVSRFGVMFFEDPVAAFTNIRAAASPGARLTFVCWREGDNPMFSAGVDVLAARLESPPPAPEPGEPGPLAFGNADYVRGVLNSSGWEEVGVEPFDGICDFSSADSDGVEERLTMLLANRTGQAARGELVERLGEDGWAEVVEELRVELDRHRVDGVMKFPGRTWVVTGVNP
ncbi:class I SAM-dependent methyltransferase [Mycobacterium sp. 1274756.6]|uniref:class I SAM-dependent methyltransferase n=1 Tax=Mycobacterium sp. 1274756.6 TaxID=1834076 RepID=UPI0007FBC7AB|nr:class I SAM-dependent methyltransferase [Mycobacterium sp. 1274756.6]OBJ71042.1 methyltransferase type 11 [Mycobacterium sp. 1274756.6]